MNDNVSEIQISVGKVVLKGLLGVPKEARGIVLFAHGSGSGRLSPRNNQVAKALREAGVATLLFDLLTEEEEIVDDQTAELRFNIPFLAERLLSATEWLSEQRETKNLNIGYFGASTGAGAAIEAAAKKPDLIQAVVSRGGRPDLADKALALVKAPTLLIVGGDDDVVIGMNETAFVKLTCVKKLEIVPGATHLFEEPGTLEQVCELAKAWFLKYLS
jgi:putative phosphoribosyl transferase